MGMAMTSSQTANDIELSNVCKQYQQPTGILKVVDNISFEMKRGTTLSIVGPSGCGKSTILRLIAEAEEVTSGRLVICRERADARAVIEQAPSLFPWRTAFQNAYLGTEIHISRMRKRARDKSVNDNGVAGPPNFSALRRKIVDDFSLFNLKGFEDTYPENLSGGMQQRVAIIRALQSEPRMLLCDEPFSAVDFVTRLQLNTAFKRISRNIGCTTVFITHNIEEAIFIGDRVIVLSHRPCSIVADITPYLSVSPHDAVECRRSPEFPVLFDQIWKLLNR